jgi:hypothetical protein
MMFYERQGYGLAGVIKLAAQDQLALFGIVVAIAHLYSMSANSSNP